MLRPMKSGRILSFSSLVLTLGLASACSSSSEETPDASPDGSGGGGVKAEVVPCTAAATKQITTSDTEAKFTPAAMTVTKGTLVKFVLSSQHDVHSGTLFTIAKGQTECVKFNEAGTYTFFCAPHGFTGTVTVQ